MTDNSPFIDVVLKDGSFCLMAPHALDLMLRQDQVRQFRRAEGWSIVGKTPTRDLRGRKKQAYAGPERRKSRRP